MCTAQKFHSLNCSLLNFMPVIWLNNTEKQSYVVARYYLLGKNPPLINHVADKINVTQSAIGSVLLTSPVRIYFTYLSDTEPIENIWEEEAFFENTNPLSTTLVCVTFPWRTMMHCGAKQNCCQNQFVLLLMKKLHPVLIKQTLMQHL